MLKKRLDGIFGTLDEEKAVWEAKREAMREGFMKELEAGEAVGPAATVGVAEGRKESIAKGSSDDDAVMVGKGGYAMGSNPGGGGGGGGAKNKKKKGKR